MTASSICGGRSYASPDRCSPEVEPVQAGVVDGANRHSSPSSFAPTSSEVRFAGVPVESSSCASGTISTRIRFGRGRASRPITRRDNYLRKVFPALLPAAVVPFPMIRGLWIPCSRAVAARIRLPCSLPAPAGIFLTWIFLGANMETRFRSRYSGLIRVLGMTIPFLSLEDPVLRHGGHDLAVTVPAASVCGIPVRWIRLSPIGSLRRCARLYGS